MCCTTSTLRHCAEKCLASAQWDHFRNLFALPSISPGVEGISNLIAGTNSSFRKNKITSKQWNRLQNYWVWYTELLFHLHSGYHLYVCIKNMAGLEHIQELQCKQTKVNLLNGYILEFYHCWMQEGCREEDACSWKPVLTKQEKLCCRSSLARCYAFVPSVVQLLLTSRLLRQTLCV